MRDLSRWFVSCGGWRSFLQEAQKGLKAREVEEVCVFVGRYCLIVDFPRPVKGMSDRMQTAC